VVNLAPPNDFAVRPFQRGDAPLARRLIESVWHEHFGLHPNPFVWDFIYSRLSDIDDAESLVIDRSCCVQWPKQKSSARANKAS